MTLNVDTFCVVHVKISLTLTLPLRFYEFTVLVLAILTVCVIIEHHFRGHGTYIDGDKLIASVAGVVERVNKLICVRPFKTR